MLLHLFNSMILVSLANHTKIKRKYLMILENTFQNLENLKKLKLIIF